MLREAPLSLIFKLLRKNGVKVNRKKQPQDFRISEGEIIEIYLKDEEFEEFLRSEREESEVSSTKTSTNLDILYEDSELLVINKDPGISVHPGDHKSDSASLIEVVQDYLEGKYNSLTFRPSLVHRIDRDTSGVILIAKTKRALDFLLAELQGDRMEKIYEAIVVGIPNPKRGSIRKKLLRVEEAKNENKVRVDESLGLPAVTHYETRKELVAGKYSLVECRIETGRTHQIRVHLASIGTPILGDRTYGSIPENSFAKRQYGVARQFLHAKSLTFCHPVTQKMLRVEAPYKEDMKNFLS